MNWVDIPAERLGEGGHVAVSMVDTEYDLYWEIAFDMFARIEANEALGLNTVFIVPVGPVGQYRRFAELCNRRRLDLGRVHFINMDEYLEGHPSGNTGQRETWIPYESPFSFRAFMDRECYSRIDPVLVMPEENRFFPSPGREDEIARRIEELGGVDTCYGGVGINGHIAFNEPPEGPMMTAEEFAALPTRCLDLSRETRTINSVTAASGCIDLLPSRCITVGMREILASRRIRLYLNRDWQKGIVRKLLHGGVDARTPASLITLHADAAVTLTRSVAQLPLGQLR
jgi:glucosamine-6-phosphate deaminase